MRSGSRRRGGWAREALTAGKVVDRLRADALRAASDVRRGGGQRGEQREREHPASRVTAK
eukprot:2275325-Prymnesium_polylepis.1